MVRKKKPFPFFIWHRRIGIAASLLVIIIAITGICLNHTESIELDKKYIKSTWLLNWYGIKPPSASINFKTESHQITQWQEQVFFNLSPILNTENKLIGVIEQPLFVILAFGKEITLLTNEGKIVERVAIDARIKSIQRIGIKDKRLIIENKNKKYFISDQDIVEWKKTNVVNINWSQSSELDKQTSKILQQRFRHNSLTLERVILDLHSGRIFGSWGVYMMDVAALLLIFLSFSGIWVWGSRRRKQRQKHHYLKHHRI